MKSLRGVLFLSWGEKGRSVLPRAIESLKQWHPELPYFVKELPDDSTLLDKARMFEYSPFISTLFLDTDTVVLGRLDFAFDQAEKFGIAVCINECPWARRFTCIEGDQIEYNCGVIAFSMSAHKVFERWAEIASKIDSSILFVNEEQQLAKMENNDQAGFALAMQQLNFNPAALPINWNFRPIWMKSFFGQIKIWHSYSPVPESLIEWNRLERESDSRIVCYCTLEQK